MPMKSSGDLVGFLDLFSVNKFHAFNDLCEVFEAAQFSPVFLGTFTKFERKRLGNYGSDPAGLSLPFLTV